MNNYKPISNMAFLKEQILLILNEIYNSSNFEKTIGVGGGIITYICSLLHPIIPLQTSVIDIQSTILETFIKFLGAIITGAVLWWMTHWFKKITKSK